MTRIPMPAVMGRLIVMLGGEALQSGFHFGLNLALLHVLSATHYGVFALAMVMGGLGLTYVRALTAMPASIRIGQSRTRHDAAAQEVTFGTGALLVSLATTALVAVVLDIWVEAGVLPGALFIGLWTLRSHLRTVGFARQRQPVVNVSDLVFTGSGALLSGLAIANGVDVLAHTLSALAVANALGIAVMLVFSRALVRVSLRAAMRRRYGAMRHQLAWSLVSVTTTNIQGQGMAFLVAGLAGPAAFAPIAAALVMFVPLRIAATALANMMQPELAAMVKRGETTAVRRKAIAWTGLMGLAGLVYGAAVALVLPLVAIRALEGASVYLIAMLAWAFYTLTMMSVMPRILLEILSAFRAITLITVASAILGTAVIVPVLMMGHSTWALLGGVLSEAVVLAASSVVVLRRLGGVPRQPLRSGGTCGPAPGLTSLHPAPSSAFLK